MNKRQFVGKTLEDALDQAAREFDTDRDNLGYAIVPDEGGGLLKKLLFRSIKIEAWLEHTEDLQAAARRAVREAIDGGGGGNSRSDERGRNQNSRGGKKSRPEDRNQPPRDAARSSGETHAPSSARRPGHNAAQPTRTGRDGQRRATQPPPKNRTASQPESSVESRQNGRKAPSGESPRRRGEPSGQGPAGERTAVISFDTPGVDDMLRAYTEVFLRVFDAELRDATFTRLESGDMAVTVQSDELEDLLERSDKLSSSYEHIFKRMVQKKLGDLPDRLVLDAGQASAKRAENLQELARSLAAKVKESGKSVTLNSRSGQERRVIHLTIDEIEGVATRSIGTGDGRKLVIYSTERAASRQRGGGNHSQRREQQAGGQHGQGGRAHPEPAMVTGDGETAPGTTAARPNRRRTNNHRGRGPSRKTRQPDSRERGAGSEVTDVAAQSDDSY